MLRACERSCIRSISFHPVISTFTTCGDLSRTGSESFSPVAIGWGRNPARKSRPCCLTVSVSTALYIPGFPSLAARMSCEYTPSRVPLAAAVPICSAEGSRVCRGGRSEVHSSFFRLCRYRPTLHRRLRLGSGADSRTQLGANLDEGVPIIRSGRSVS